MSNTNLLYQSKYLAILISPCFCKIRNKDSGLVAKVKRGLCLVVVWFKFYYLNHTSKGLCQIADRRNQSVPRIVTAVTNHILKYQPSSYNKTLNLIYYLNYNRNVFGIDVVAKKKRWHLSVYEHYIEANRHILQKFDTVITNTVD